MDDVYFWSPVEIIHLINSNARSTVSGCGQYESGRRSSIKSILNDLLRLGFSGVVAKGRSRNAY